MGTSNHVQERVNPFWLSYFKFSLPGWQLKANFLFSFFHLTCKFNRFYVELLRLHSHVQTIWTPHCSPVQPSFTPPFRSLLCFRVNVDAEKCHGWVNTLGKREIPNEPFWKAETEVLLISFSSCCQTCFSLKITLFIFFPLICNPIRKKKHGSKLPCKDKYIVWEKMFAALFMYLSIYGCV